MSEIESIREEIIEALANADTSRVLQILLRLTCWVEVLEEHQHTYYADPGISARPFITAPQREIVSPSQKIFEEQAAVKRAAKEGT